MQQTNCFYFARCRYDIDVLINRTLIYGVLTVVLALAYALTVFVLLYLLNGLAGGSQLAMVGSTLVIAGLFQPRRKGAILVGRPVECRFIEHVVAATQDAINRAPTDWPIMHVDKLIGPRLAD